LKTLDTCTFSVYNKTETICDFGDRNDIDTHEKYKRISVRTANAMSLSHTLRDKADTVRYCGSNIWLNRDTGQVEAANFCRERLCPMCQRRKALKQFANALTLADIVGKQYIFLHLVLTVKNCKGFELSDTIRRMNKASREFFAKRRIKQGFKGALRTLEVTYNKRDRTFHPHFHCLVAVLPSYPTSRYYLRHDILRMEWQKALGVDYLPQVFVTKCDEGGFAEVSKYCLKPLDLNLTPYEHSKVLDTLNSALKGKRLLQYFGVLREVKAALNNAEDDEVAQTPAEQVEGYTFNFSALKYEKMTSI